MKNIIDYDFYEISPSEARTIGPFGENDYPVTITCYNQKEQWNSMKAAKAFYTAGSNCSGGSERERYCTIVSKLMNGSRDVNDNF